jgi:enoyl-CoA hydratase
MTTAPMLLAEDTGAVRLLTLNRPEARNALTGHLISQVRAAMAEADADPAVAVIVLTGADPAFCAGLDLRSLGDPEAGWGKLEDGTPPGHPWAPLSKPLIGAVNGAAVTGGLEFALACDILVASERDVQAPYLDAARAVEAAAAEKAALKPTPERAHLPGNEA